MWKSVPRSHQKVLCQGKFLWYPEVQSSSYITSLQNKHLKVKTKYNRLGQTLQYSHHDTKPDIPYADDIHTQKYQHLSYLNCSTNFLI